MIRRTLFFGITLILVVVLAGLVFRGCQGEKQQAEGPMEVVRESRPSPVRVFGPGDLEIVRSRFEWNSPPGAGEAGAAAGHEVEIRNHGTVPYQGVRLAFAYLDARGRILATETYTHGQTVPPGEARIISGIEIASVPAAAVGLETSVLYADLAAPEPETVAAP